MSNPPCLLTSSGMEKLSGPTAQSNSSSGDLDYVQRRSLKAAKFFDSVGLANGDLPKEIALTQSEHLSLAGSPEKTHNDENATLSSVRQRLSPVFSAANNYGAPWMKTVKPTRSDTKHSMKDGAATKNGFTPKKIPEPCTSYKSPHKTFSQTHNDDTASISHCPAVSVRNGERSEEKSELKTLPSYSPENKNNSSDICPTVPTKTEDKNTSRTSDCRNKNTHESLSRIRSHLYEKQQSNHVPREHHPKLKDSNTKPNLKPMQQASSEHCSPQHPTGTVPESSELSEISSFSHSLASSTESTPRKKPSFRRQRSNSDSQHDVFVSESRPQQSYDFPDGKFFGIRLSQSFASTSSLSDTNKNDRSASPVGGFVLENQKNGTPPGTPPRSQSPASKLFRKSPSASPGGSPKPHRKLKRKTRRSRSDVPNHKVILNRLQSEGDAQALLHQCELTEEQERRRRHHFAHYDWQSMMFSFQDVLVAMATLKRKITISGASQAAALVSTVSMENLASKGSSVGGSQEDISMYLEEDGGLEDNKFNNLVASCPFFRNEIGGEADRSISVTASSGLSVQVRNDGDATTKQAENVLSNHTYLSVVENESCDKLCAPNLPPSGKMSFGIEQVDGGATYYRTHFFDKEHQNLFCVDERYGPIVISLRREKLEDEEVGAVYQYRIIVRTCELCTLRGSILEDVIHPPRNPSNKGIPVKDVLEYVCPEINISCLKIGAPSSKFNDQLMKVDEQNIHDAYKMGILYCRAGQTSEDDMYSNEHGSEAFNDFLDLLGEKVKLCGFEGFRGGLDVRGNTTGTESVFTTFQDHELMFHVSTLLPFTPNNKQQVLRKRHIGNDITTIVFQEPGSEPFDPKCVCSHFQHIFVVVRVHNPCSEDTCYSVAVARSRNIPRFGPPIPEDSMFPSSSTFRDFLLTKLINGENAACAAGKFKALAMNTRAQYLRDLATDSATQGGLEGNARFGKFSRSVTSRRIRESKEKPQKVVKPEYLSHGALTWHVSVDDYSSSDTVPCMFGMSECFLMMVEKATKQLIFSIPCQAVLGWTVPPPSQEQLKTYRRMLFIYYGRGERITLFTNDIDSRDEITMRLERFTKGSETLNRELRRNDNGQLGFRVNYEGIVAEVEPNGYASRDGLKQSSRLVEICKVPVVTKTHEEIIDLLANAVTLKVVVIPPNDDGTPRKCSMELYHLYPVLEAKKVCLSSTLTRDASYARSKSEPMKRLPKNPSCVRSESEAARAILYGKCRSEPTTSNPCVIDLSRSRFTKTKVRKTILAKTNSDDDTEAVLTATATRLSSVGVTSGYSDQRGSTKGVNFHDNQSSVDSFLPCLPSSNLNNHSNRDADLVSRTFPRRNARAQSQPSNSYCFQPSKNSNNNSSYTNTADYCLEKGLHHCNRESTFNSPGESQMTLRNQNNNNSSMSPWQEPQVQPKRPRNDISLLEERNIQIQNAFSRSKFQQTTSFSPFTSSLSRTEVDRDIDPRFRKSFRNRILSNPSIVSPQIFSSGVQNSLVSLLTFERPPDLVTSHQTWSPHKTSLWKGAERTPHMRKPSLPIATPGFPIRTAWNENMFRAQDNQAAMAKQKKLAWMNSCSFYEYQQDREHQPTDLQRLHHIQYEERYPFEVSHASCYGSSTHLEMTPYSFLTAPSTKTKFDGSSRRRSNTVSAV